MMNYVLGLDLGTTHIKAVLIGTDGKTILAIKERINTIRSAIYCAEQDVASIWFTVVHVLRQVAGQSKIPTPDVIVFSGAMQNLLALNNSLQPVANAWIWSDFRAKLQADEIRQLPEARVFYQQTGCPLQPVYHPARLAWIKEHDPDLFQSTRCWVGIKDFIIFQMTGALSTDCGMASTTGLLNLSDRQWNQDLLDICCIQEDQLPSIISPSEIAGKLNSLTAELTGLKAGTPIYTGSTDGALANFGSGAVSPGDTVISVATGLAVRISSCKPWFDPQERTWTYLFRPGEYVVGGAGNNGGLAIQWVREQFYRDLPDDIAYQTIFDDAASIPRGAEGVKFEPYFNGNRTPHWRADMTAGIFGLTSSHSRKHIARAAVEGIAREVGDIWAVLKESGIPREPVFLSGTFCSQPVWMEILQNELGVKVIPVESPDVSAFGAAKMILNL